MRISTVAVFLVCYVAFYCTQGVSSFPLDDTHLNGLLEDDGFHHYSAVYSAVDSRANAVSSLGTLTYLGISQHIQAPTLTNPPRMPVCISSAKLTDALTTAINDKFARLLQSNASIDTTYTQVRTTCNYESFITLEGPEELKLILVYAATANKLCELLPQYCAAINLVPAPAPSTKVQTAVASSGTPKTSSTNNGDASQAASSPSTPTPTSPIDGTQQQRHPARRRSISSTEPYILISSDGTANPELPPVLDFKCVKHNYTQVLDHFSHEPVQFKWRRSYLKRAEKDSDASQDAHDHGQPRSDTPHTADKQHGTFTQVYWVCDAAWPKEPSNQRENGNVLVFLGNESPLGIPQQPIVFENARRLNALVVLVEHRYYGESLPFPEPNDARVPTDEYKWLTIEQVIEDTVSVVQHVRKERDVPSAVPNVVIGGSYGGMIASYHRVMRPDVFDAAVAASAPIYYIVDTDMWSHTSNRYHQFIQDAVNTMSGSLDCSTTVLEGLDEMLHLGSTAEGRDEVATALNLCGNGSTALPSEEYVLGLQNDVIGTFQGIAQVNNQPPLLGEMAVACEVVNNATKAGDEPLLAIAALLSYMYSNGSGWCYNLTYDPRFPVLPDVPTGYNSYTYQCCTEATVYSSELPAKGSDSTLNPEDIPVPVKTIEENCRNIFGKHVPKLQGPSFTRHILPLLKKYGNVVFTNGDLDGWAGGSLGLLPVIEDVPERGRLRASNGDFKDLDSPTGGLDPEQSRVAFIVYKNASHCTDTHTYAWNTPGEPEEWKKQRAMAMDYAVMFAKTGRKEPVT